MTCTLICDGSSDRALLPIISWCLLNADVNTDLEMNWADLRGVRPTPVGLQARISKALELYPCHILFIHRDAEAQSPRVRIEEVTQALSLLGDLPPHVCVVPVRMLESWLLLSEAAIRYAAGNPNGHDPLPLPRPQTVEGLADPKALLFELLRSASGRHGRKLRSFDVQSARTLITQYIGDFTALRTLESFNVFEEDLRRVVQTYHLDNWL